MTALLTTPAELDELMRSGRAPVVLDVRWRLGGPHGGDAHREAHIPGALFADLDADLAAHGEPAEGRHPLPSAAAFEASVRRWGIDDGDTVVVYDDAMGFGPARAWWMLRDAGIDARVLDGGLAAWRAAGLPVASGDETTEPGTATLHPGQLPQLTIDEAAALAAGADGVLLDARAGERYRGETEPIDPVAGHIPGATNVPVSDFFAADGRLPSADRVTELLDHPGPLAAYCGSGVSAAQLVLAGASIDRPIALYPGSWSAWSNDPARPVATGEPGAA